MTAATLAKAAASLAGMLLVSALGFIFTQLWNATAANKQALWQLERDADSGMTEIAKTAVNHGVRLDRVERDVDRLERGR